MASGVEATGAIEMPQIDAEGGSNVPAAGSLPKMLFSEGFFVVAVGTGALVMPPKGMWSRSLFPLAYYTAGVVLVLFGGWLLKLSFVVAGNRDRRTLAKAVMWATLAPLLLVVALHLLAN